MADGAITFSTTLDNSDLEKSLKAVEREIESLKRKIEESKGEESFAKSQMDAAKAATEKAKQAVEKLREELGVTDDAALAESLKAATREVSQLEAGLRKANEGKSAIEEQMDAGEAAIRQTEQSLRELQARLGELENADPTNADEWFAAQREISGVKSALADANASLDKQIADQDRLNDKWQALDEKAADYAARLEGASARQAELASKSSRLSAANDALKQQSAEQDRLTKKWESTNAQTEKYTRQLDRATKKQQELSAEYSRTYSAAGAAVGAGMERARASMSAFSDKVQTMLKRVFVFGIILKGIRAVSEALGTALGQNLRFSAAWENLRATVTGVANAIANLVAPALVGMVNAATAAIETLAKTVDDLFGLGIMSAIRSARAAAEANWRQTDASKDAQKALDKQAKATKGLAKEQDKARKSLLAFDEVNALQADDADDAADELGDEADGIVDPSTLMNPDWGAFDVGKIDAKLAEIMLMLGAAIMAVGAILAFSGINIPLGLTLMVIGALMVYTAYKEQWDKLSQEVRAAITAALAITGVVLVVLGAVLAFSGVNVPLGIGMMAAGALLLWTAVGLNWESMTEDVKTVVSVLMGVLSVALIVVGAILAFSSANAPLGIGLMVLGAASLAAVAAINWERMPEDVRAVVSVVMGILGGALIVVGAILAFSGASVPLGIGLMLAGATLLAADAALNWEAVQDGIGGVIDVVMGILDDALVVIGALLCATGHIPLGIAAIIASIAVFAIHEEADNESAMPEKIQRVVGRVTAILGPAIAVIGALLCATGHIPLGIAAIIAGIAAFAIHEEIDNESAVPEKMQRVVGRVMGILSPALAALGMVLCATGHIPLGIAAIIAGIAAFAISEESDNEGTLPDKVTRVVDRILQILGASLAAIGAILCATGHIPLGIAAIIAGVVAFSIHEELDDETAMPNKVERVVGQILRVLGGALAVIGAILCATGHIPLGIAAIIAGAAALALQDATDDESAVVDKVRRVVDQILGIVGTSLMAIGLVLCVTGNIPLGIGFIIAGAASWVLSQDVDWDFLVNKVREIWSSITRFWNENIAPVFTAQWWENLFISIVNGLIGAVNDGLNAFGTFVSGIAGGISDVLNFFGVQWTPFTVTMPQIPYLAQGAVIPPNREFMAVLGDQRHGNNIEAPEALMRQVVREETAPMLEDVISALLVSGTPATGGGDRRDVVLQVGRRELARETLYGLRELAATGELGGGSLLFT